MHTNLQVVGVKKLNKDNYDKWATCMESYLQGQDLWEVFGGNEVTQPEEDANGILRKWKIKAGGALKNHDNSKRFERKCYNCGKTGHIAKDYWSNKRLAESNVATSKPKEKNEDEWDAKASFAMEEEELALTITMAELLVAYIGKTIVALQYSPNQVPLQDVYHVLDKTRRNKTVDLWHMWLGHVSFSKLSMMMKKLMLNGLPRLDARTDTVCVGCQYERIWAEAMRTAAFVINKLPQQRLGFVSPFEKFWDMKPTVSYFRVLGYDSQRKGWKCCDPITGRCYTSRNVVFDEASSWWSLEKESTTDSKEFRDKLQQRFGEQTALIRSSSKESEDSYNGDSVRETHNP
ncbi:hypothetical protein Patl1_19397 [Pistacia atlantica]|uniref:Uncharacterized protein n=1 Tax=Pistacia atlantica TaxID=434234 RepID=A0ACC1BXX8_9ROSI|nr:hypothetical protein Patl1_19397 [Pistacia atlantica]